MSATQEQIAKIRKQVEFYFSDSNLPFDKYLWTLTQKNPEGWVELAKIASFKRMQMITKDLNTVIEALRSEPSDLIELDEKNENIRRSKPLVYQNFFDRSIYAKGFPLVDQAEDAPQDCLYDLQDKITDFFEQHGRVLAVRLRKTDERPSKFKGSVYVEFSTPEEAQKVAAMSLQYEGTDLELKTKREYVDEKSEKYKHLPEKTWNKKRFNAFHLMEEKQNRVRPDKYRQKAGDRGQNKRGFINYRLVTFANAKNADEETIKSILGAEEIASITRSEDGTGYALLNKGSSKQKVISLRELPKEELKGIRFRFADDSDTAAYEKLTKPEPKAGEKRKAEDEE